MATLNVAVRATPMLMSEEATFGVVCHTTLCSIFGDTAFLCVEGCRGANPIRFGLSISSVAIVTAGERASTYLVIGY